jgi:hypothetical protein
MCAITDARELAAMTERVRASAVSLNPDQGPWPTAARCQVSPAPTFLSTWPNPPFPHSQLRRHGCSAAVPPAMPRRLTRATTTPHQAPTCTPARGWLHHEHHDHEHNGERSTDEHDRRHDCEDELSGGKSERGNGRNERAKSKKAATEDECSGWRMAQRMMMAGRA